ncbi:MAG: T9SS type A sorting domain-containing protein [Bacteroidota bacterium]
MRSTLRLFALLTLLCTAAAVLFAGGPLYTMNGKAMRYQSNVITYKVDRGPFGVFTSAQARTLAEASFKTWEDVTTSNVSFNHTSADTLPVDVNGTNYLQYTTLTDFKYDGMSPIIFDSDGSITDALFGAGASDAVIGFAGSGDSNNDGYFEEGESVMNGVFADGSAFSYTLEEWKSTFVHEFGHFLGLDHTQINGEFENDAAKTIYVPTMYPFATANDVPLGDLNPDDIAAISTLYPEPTYAASIGKISGSVVRANNSVVRGANVIAISTGADSLMNRISTVTDYFVLNNGNYTVTGLTPGSYVVRIEPIDQNFIEGSSVGPYALDLTDLSFVNPVTMEYYNGANESSDPATDDPNAKTPITVSAGGTIASINFIGNKAASGPGLSLLSEDFTGTSGTALTSAGWTISGSSVVNPISIVQPGLTFSGYSTSGNAAALNNNGQDVYKAFTPVSSGAVYLSFIMKVDSVKTGDYFIALSASTAQTNYFSRLHVKASGAGFLIGINKLSELSGGNKYGTTVYNLKTNYLVVVKYEFVAGTANDILSVFAFNTSLPSTEPASGEITGYTNAAADAADLGIVTLRQGSSTAAPNLVIDGIKVGTAWPGIVTGLKEIASAAVPASIELMQNYPNPFNPSTSIRFALPSAQYAAVKVYDLLGRQIVTLADGNFSAGTHEVTLNGTALSSGSYFYTLETGNRREIKRMVLLK